MCFFSIVIPAYNRPGHVQAAVESCLAQTDADLEVVVVDDASTDATAATVEAIADPRVRLVRHAVNRGLYPARQTGADAARGTWLLFLDSDEELLPGSLATLRARLAQRPDFVGRVALMYRFDDGRTSPQPGFGDQVLDYAGVVRWHDGLTGSMDFLPCTHRDCFGQVRYPEARRNGGGLYNLDFARAYPTWTVPDLAALSRTDAPNRNQASSQRAFVRDAPSAAQAGLALLERHGAALAAMAPHAHQHFLRAASGWCFLAGRRREGARCVLRYLRYRPLSADGWLSLAFGLLGPKASAWSRVQRRRWRGRPVGT